MTAGLDETFAKFETKIIGIEFRHIDNRRKHDETFEQYNGSNKACCGCNFSTSLCKTTKSTNERIFEKGKKGNMIDGSP